MSKCIMVRFIKDEVGMREEMTSQLDFSHLPRNGHHQCLKWKVMKIITSAVHKIMKLSRL